VERPLCPTSEKELESDKANMKGTSTKHTDQENGHEMVSLRGGGTLALSLAVIHKGQKKKKDGDQAPKKLYRGKKIFPWGRGPEVQGISKF